MTPEKSEMVEIKLGRFTFNVPVVDDVENTLEIAQAVNDRMALIEKTVPSAVNTVDCALLTAFSLMTELRATREETEDERQALKETTAGLNREFLEALDVIQTSLGDILGKYS
jgi:cell division protein ZapA (FtsZ GTPase activity inhibitor)